MEFCLNFQMFTEFFLIKCCFGKFLLQKCLLLHYLIIDAGIYQSKILFESAGILVCVAFILAV